MITLRFGRESLARIRYAVSPLTEAMRSILALENADSQAIHLPWVKATAPATRGLDLAPLRELLNPDFYTPDFISPPPLGPLAELEDELDRVLQTTPEQAVAEIRSAYEGGPLPVALEPYLADPEHAVERLCELIRRYWEIALAAHWPRIRALLQGDVLYRARRMADGGAGLQFADIDPSIRWDGQALLIDKRAEQTLELDHEGLVLVPSVFVWPRVIAITDPAWQPTLVYPARGVGTLWDPGERTGGEALGALIGVGRAAILRRLEEPWSTTDLAQALRMSPGGVSEHLTTLRDAGLVNGHRVGRTVLYMRSPLGDALADADDRAQDGTG